MQCTLQRLCQFTGAKFTTTCRELDCFGILKRVDSKVGVPPKVKLMLPEWQLRAAFEGDRHVHYFYNRFKKVYKEKMYYQPIKISSH